MWFCNKKWDKNISEQSLTDDMKFVGQIPHSVSRIDIWVQFINSTHGSVIVKNWNRLHH